MIITAKSQMDCILQVWQVRPDRNLLLLKGSIPGSENGFVLIKKATKKGA